MKLFRPNRNRAFTLMELLIVIAIMVVIAGLVVGLAGVAGEKQKMSRARAEGEKIATMIETYRLKLGFLPPHNTNNPGNNSLVYELAGAERDALDPTLYHTPWGPVTSNGLFAAFGVTGIINSSTDRTEIKRILKQLKPDEFVTSGPENLRRFVLPVDDANGNRPNYWQYLAGTEDDVKKRMRNPDGFDLWVEMQIRGNTRISGNWKD